MEHITLANDCRTYLGKDVRHGEESILWREQNKDYNVTRDFAQTRQPGHFEPFFLPQDKARNIILISNSDPDQIIVERIDLIAGALPPPDDTHRH